MCRTRVQTRIALCSALLLCLCASPVAGGDQVSIDVTLGTDVGIGFDKLTQEAHSLQVTLHAIDGYTIARSNRLDNSGTHLWMPAENTTPGTDHIYSVTGVFPNDGHAVRFHGDLTKGAAGSGQAIFDMAVADLDTDADTNNPPRHCGQNNGPNWPPDGSAGEDLYEIQAGYGLKVPRLWASYNWPAPEQVETLNYKTLRVALKARSADPNRSFVGKLTFTNLGNGVAIYCGTTTRSQAKQIAFGETILVPNGGISEEFRIMTNLSFSGTVTITATFEWDDDLKQLGKSYQAIDDLIVARVCVIASAPEGRFVGTGKDTRPIPLEAEYEFGTGGETYAWSKVGGSGNGTFNDAAAQNPEFTGTQRGDVTVQVVANGSDYSTLDLVVIEINDLAEDDPNEEATEVYLEGEEAQYTVPYSTANGDLRGVYIAPPEDADDPFGWDEDFSAEVNHLDGSVTLTLDRSGPCLVKIVRDLDGTETSAFLLVELNGAVGRMDGESVQAGKYVKVETPTGDLVLISSASGANDNGYVKAARKHYTNYKDIGSVRDAAMEIAKCPVRENENDRISVVIVDHGTVGDMAMGCGMLGEAGKYLTINTTQDLDYFTGICKGRVRELTHTGCAVGFGDVGAALLQKLHVDGDMKVWAPTKQNTWDDDGYWGRRGFEWAHKP
jgi:hypothetical protein